MLTRGEGVEGLFAEQVMRAPERVAVLADGESMTYRELERRANRLAHRLVALGIGPDVPVGVCVDRSAGMVVALLAVLKAGGSYVPLDPAFPAQRLRFMLDDSGATVLISQRAVLQRLDFPGHQVILIGPAGEISGGGSVVAPGHSAGAENLAYIIYTSGSTGVPKGVAMSRAALDNMIRWHSAEHIIEPGTRALQYAAYGFDVSLQEALAVLTTGGSLVVMHESDRRDFDRLRRLIMEYRVETLFITPGALRELARSCRRSGEFPRVRTLIAAGEPLALTPPLVEWCRRSGAELQNHYGPAETHCATSHRLASPVSGWPEHPPIGTPITNTDVCVMDPAGQPVEDGQIGELWIGGAGVARGYIGLPELTADRFVTHPAGSQHRMYRTGDLVRWRAGRLEFVGRADDQVKIRGYRIELGEIEAALAGLEGVEQVTVVAEHDSGTATRLLAYVVGSAAESLDAGALRRTLAQRLPDYMIPSVFIELPQLPLTNNGKVNRKALPKPEEADLLRQQTFVQPQAGTEATIAEVFAEVLGLQDISANDDFFSLGGHSLLATQVVSRLRERLNTDLTVRDFFRYRSPTGITGFLASRLATIRQSST